MKNVLIFSNCAASGSESNGRMHMTQFQKYLDGNHLHNFYVRGNPDLENIKYLNISYKDALLSKLTFGIKKPSLNSNAIKSGVNASESISSKSANPFYHWARNKCFSNNRSIFKTLCEYVLKNKIEALVIWGSNVPFLYELIRKISNKTGIKYITITCEDYPLKKYCYLKKHNVFFNFFQRQLRKQCIKCYKGSSKNIYCNIELKNLYEKETETTNGEVIYLGSSLKRFEEEKTKKVKNVLYGGNLYDDRLKSIIDVAEVLNKRNIALNIYGKTSEENIKLLKEHTNINYFGVVPFSELVKHFLENDALLHVEGFSKEYINDCRFAFSTKISDYIVTGKKIIAYGPKEISGINFLLKEWMQVVATNKNDLDLVIDYIESDDYVSSDVYKEFKTELVSEKVFKIMESL